MNSEKLPTKLALIGTASSGKTTLANAYEERFSGSLRVRVLKQAARAYLDAHPEVLERVHILPVQRAILNHVVEQETDAYQPGVNLIISDGSVLEPGLLLSFYKDRGANRLLDQVKNWIPTYTRFLLTDPTEVPFEPDPLRKETEEERLAIHGFFEEFLQSRGLPYEIVSGSVEERVTRINQVIFECIRDKTIFVANNHTVPPFDQKFIA